MDCTRNARSIRCAAVQPLAAIVLAALLLAAMLFWASGHGTRSVRAAPPHEGPIQTLDGGQVITIGVAAQVSGGGAAEEWGWQEVNSVQLAVAQANATGGITIGGTAYAVRLAVEDDLCDGSQAANTANKLIDAGAVAVVGHECSSASLLAAGVYNAVGLTMMSPSSTAPALTRQGFTTTFRTVPSDGARSSVLAEYFIGSGRKRAAVLNRNFLHSPQLGAEYQTRYSVLGGTVVSSQTLLATADITPALSAIQNQSVDVIVVADLIGDMAGEVSRVAYRMGMAPIIASTEVDDRYISEWAGPQAAEGDYAAMAIRRTSQMPGYSSFLAEYLEAGFNHEPDDPGPFGPYAYDATNIIIEAIRRAHSTDTLAIRDEIAATSNCEGVVRTYAAFDAYGDVVPHLARVEVVQNGEWVPALLVGEVYPAQGGTLDLDNTWGQTTTVEVPAGMTADTLVVTYTIIADLTDTGVPTLTVIGSHGSRLETNQAVTGRMTLTVRYEDVDVVGVDESTLMLYTWDGGRWVAAEVCGPYMRDLEHNVLQVILCHFSDYALVGETDRATYLPVIRKK